MIAASLLVLIKRLVWLTAVITLPFNLLSPSHIGFARSEETIISSDALFVGQQDTTRDKAAVISAVNGSPSADASDSLLSDITGHWAEEPIREAVSIGFVSGYEDGTFKPDNALTLAELAAMLTSSLAIPLISESIDPSDQADPLVSSDHADQPSQSEQLLLQSAQDRHIQSLLDVGIVHENEFAPYEWKETLSRTLLIKLALRAIDPAFAEDGLELGKHAVAADLLDSGQDQAAWIAKAATRADVVVVLHRLRKTLGIAINVPVAIQS
jgi:hypothetical protein